MDHLITGNTADDTTDTRGWLIGNFIVPDNLRHSTNVEIKWARHAAGERRDGWADAKHTRSLALLISGNFTITFPNREVTLARQGDYVLYDNTFSHQWCANQDSTVVTVRWFSN